MSSVRVVHADCLRYLETLRPSSADAIVCDPPYGLGFMGAGWDHQVPGPVYWRAMLRVAKPGAYLLAFGAPRLWHRLTCAIEDAGWEIRDSILRLAGELDGPLFWLRGDGNPKVRKLDKLLEAKRDDRALLLELTAWIASARDAAKLTNAQIDLHFGFAGMAGHWTTQGQQPTAPTLEQFAKLVELFGLAGGAIPERVVELVELLNARKGTPGEAFLERPETGRKMMADLQRARPASMKAQGVERSPMREVAITAPATEEGRLWQGYGHSLKLAWEPVVLGMRPLEGTMADNARRWGVAGLNLAGAAIPGEERPTFEKTRAATTGNCYGVGLNGSRSLGASSKPRHPANVAIDELVAEELDAGEKLGPSRFFFRGKARKADRGRGNNHPTVKPTDVMEWLCSLVLPPAHDDGTPRVLVDPFAGSGTTGIGAVRAGWDEVVLIEQEAPFAALAERRNREEHGLLHRVAMERAS